MNFLTGLFTTTLFLLGFQAVGSYAGGFIAPYAASNVAADILLGVGVIGSGMLMVLCAILFFYSMTYVGERINDKFRRKPTSDNHKGFESPDDMNLEGKLDEDNF